MQLQRLADIKLRLEQDDTLCLEEHTIHMDHLPNGMRKFWITCADKTIAETRFDLIELETNDQYQWMEQCMNIHRYRVAEYLIKKLLPKCDPYHHTNASPSHGEGAWCNDCFEFAPLNNFTGSQFEGSLQPYLVDGRDSKTVKIRLEDLETIVDWWRAANEAPGGCSFAEAIKGMKQAVWNIDAARRSQQ